jgi:hypothetical protein
MKLRISNILKLIFKKILSRGMNFLQADKNFQEFLSNFQELGIKISEKFLGVLSGDLPLNL